MDRAGNRPSLCGQGGPVDRLGDRIAGLRLIVPRLAGTRSTRGTRRGGGSTGTELAQHARDGPSQFGRIRIRPSTQLECIGTRRVPNGTTVSRKAYALVPVPCNQVAQQLGTRSPSSLAWAGRATNGGRHQAGREQGDPWFDARMLPRVGGCQIDFVHADAGQRLETSPCLFGCDQEVVGLAPSTPLTTVRTCRRPWIPSPAAPSLGCGPLPGWALRDARRRRARKDRRTCSGSPTGGTRHEGDHLDPLQATQVPPAEVIAAEAALPMAQRSVPHRATGGSPRSTRRAGRAASGGGTG